MLLVADKKKKIHALYISTKKKKTHRTSTLQLLISKPLKPCSSSGQPAIKSSKK